MQFLVLAICAACVLACLRLSPVGGTELFIAADMLFPKSIEVVALGQSVAVYRIVEAAIAIGVVISVRRARSEPAPLDTAGKALLAVGVFLVVVQTFRAFTSSLGPSTAPPVHYLAVLFGVSWTVFGVLFLWVGLRYYRSVAAIERLFRLIVVLGVVAVVEGVAEYWLRIIPRSLEESLVTVSSRGRINDFLTFGGSDRVGRLCVLAVIAALYLASSRRLWPLALVPFFVLTIAGTLVFGVWASLPVALLVYFLLRLDASSPRGFVLPTAVPLAVFAGLLAFAGNLAGRLGALDPAKVFSVTYRFQLYHLQLGWLRDSLLLGVGPGLVPYYLQASTTITRFSSGHNLVLEYVAENGIVAILGVVLIVGIGVSSFRKWRAAIRQRTCPAKLVRLGAALFAMLAGIAVNVQTDSAVKAYYLYLLLVACAVHVAKRAQDPEEIDSAQSLLAVPVA